MLDNPHNYTKTDLVNHIVNCLEMDTILFYSSVRKCLYKSLHIFFIISVLIFNYYECELFVSSGGG